MLFVLNFFYHLLLTLKDLKLESYIDGGILWRTPKLGSPNSRFLHPNSNHKEIPPSPFLLFFSLLSFYPSPCLPSPMPPSPFVDAGEFKASSGANEVFASMQMSPYLWTDDSFALMQNPDHNWTTRCTKHTRGCVIVLANKMRQLRRELIAWAIYLCGFLRGCYNP